MTYNLETVRTAVATVPADSLDVHKAVGVGQMLLIAARNGMLEDAERGQKLQDFKDYVHERLDAAGIATHPDGEHSKAGCRIGDRLDIALEDAAIGRAVRAAAERDGPEREAIARAGRPRLTSWSAAEAIIDFVKKKNAGE